MSLSANELMDSDDDDDDDDNVRKATYSSQGVGSPDDRPTDVMTSPTDDSRGKQPATKSRGVNMTAKNRRRPVTSSVASQSADDLDSTE